MLTLLSSQLFIVITCMLFDQICSGSYSLAICAHGCLQGVVEADFDIFCLVEPKLKENVLFWTLPSAGFCKLQYWPTGEMWPPVQ